MALKTSYVPLPRVEYLLLYFHSVAVFDTLAPALAGYHGRTGPEWALRWLAEAAPLIREDLVFLCDSRIEDPGQQDRREELIEAAFDFTEDDENRLWAKMSVISGRETPEEEEASPEDWPVPPLSQAARAIRAFANDPHQLDVAAWDTRKALQAATSSAASSIDLWLSDRSYAPVLAEVLARATAPLEVAVPPGDRLDVMTTLSRVELPGLASLSAQDLIALRRNEDLFDEWRSALAAALRALPSNESPTATQLRTVHESLRESAHRVVDRRKRLAPQVVTGELRPFGIATLGSAVSGAIFGLQGLAAAATAAGASAIARGSREALRARRELRAIDAAQRHYAVFAPPK